MANLTFNRPELEVLPFFRENFKNMIDLLDDVQAGRILKAFLNLDDSNLEEPAEKIAYQAMSSQSVRAAEINMSRSGKMKGNQNAKKHKDEEPIITVNQDKALEQSIITKLAGYDSKCDFKVPYDEAYSHFSFVFNDLLGIAGGDEALVRNCYDRFIKNKLRQVS